MALPDPDRSRVVLIGTTVYRDKKLPDLPSVARSLNDLAEVLTDPVAGIVPERNCTVLLNEGDLRELGRELVRTVSEAEDLLVVYYAGHGLVGGKRHELYLALSDSEWEAPGFNSLEYEKLRGAVLDSPAANKVVILDCCFSGRALDGLMADPATAVLGQLDVQGTYVLTSAQRDQVALALPGEEHTAFSGRLIRLLREGVAGDPELLSVESLYLRLRSLMKAAGLPLPEKHATRTAEHIVLGRNRAFTVTPPDRPPDPEVTESREADADERASLAWDAFRPDRGNAEGACTTFAAYKRLYVLLACLVGALSFVAAAFTATSNGAVVLRVALGIVTIFLAVAAFGFVGRARSPVRLEIGAQGIQLFARSGTTWLPWNAVDSVAVRRVGGARHVVASLREAEMFPDLDTFGGGPRFMRGGDALDICSIDVLRASRHEVVRALLTYGGDRFKASAAGPPRPPIDMSADRWDDVLTVAARVENDRRQRPVDRRFTLHHQAAMARDTLARALHEAADGGPVAPHVTPWVWTTASGGRPLTRHGHETGVELRLSYYSRPPAAAGPLAGPTPPPALPVNPKRPGRLVWRVVLAVGCAFSGLMTIGAVGATVTRGFPSVWGAIVGNVLFESMLVGSVLLFGRELGLFKRK
ncbi:hypothetical protein GCM10027176_76240 [Actinoallomurus bryophytorum]|uniref:Caspase domain-containing protein n=1 Tax=Actinoallomurus bryophytorum TaxID=1490222 RepID=A0A543C175_9ACTN|nr:caspase family protein [Actinoallomurus bryophytorum]TQL90835.1 caspase domain-containing protein [Actinoallomurus bryophytorum]